MGRGSREKPGRLGEKLTQIRSALGLSQNEMLSRMGLDERLGRDDVSKYERGVREPSLIVILHYARVAGVHVEDLINDRTDLPEKLPGRVRHRT